MKPLQHIKELLDEMHRIQWHGHCRKNAAAWAAVSDIEIAIHELRKSFEQNINQPPRRLSGASERSTKWKEQLKKLGRTIRRYLSAATGG